MYNIHTHTHTWIHLMIADRWKGSKMSTSRPGQGVFSQQCVTLTHRAINIASNKFQIAVWLSFNNRRAYVDLRTAPKAAAGTIFLHLPSQATSCCMVWGEGEDSSRSGRHSDVSNIVCVPQIQTEIWRLACWGANDFQRTEAAPHTP